MNLNLFIYWKIIYLNLWVIIICSLPSDPGSGPGRRSYLIMVKDTRVFLCIIYSIIYQNCMSSFYFPKGSFQFCFSRKWHFVDILFKALKFKISLNSLNEWWPRCKSVNDAAQKVVGTIPNSKEVFNFVSQESGHFVDILFKALKV